MIDTHAGDQYDSLRFFVLSEMDLYLVLFSLVSPRTLENVRDKWMKELERCCQRVPITVVIGTHKDVREKLILDEFHDDSNVVVPSTVITTSPVGVQEIPKNYVSTQQGLSVTKEMMASLYLECDLFNTSWLEVFNTLHRTLKQRRDREGMRSPPDSFNGHCSDNCNDRTHQ
eukprot:TRINITY_DN13907_c0_g1_i2.p1 TRINITY_DN13907_c0_g1~~TRINITY_DN13907_c0_g1_i2.p1  ORF type:complete len:172 (-),score=26.52 TRINITY_DN13907_c0_g1_i2:332-847(-)